MAILLGVAGAFNNSVAHSSAKHFAGVNWKFNGTQSQIGDPSKAHSLHRGGFGS
ncbi:MAG: hypothetical protein JKY70_05725 [Mucilaginibacter sp.]|nr:hypothetical protein [Mucilaginibacter sp.]